MNLEDWLLEYGIKAQLAVAGIAGALVGMFKYTKKTPLDAFASFLAGVGASVYLTPLVAQQLALSGRIENALAFGIGVAGMNAIDFVMMRIGLADGKNEEEGKDEKHR